MILRLVVVSLYTFLVLGKLVQWIAYILNYFVIS